jgi:hypothetical protein
LPVKCRGSTPSLPAILEGLRMEEDSGMCGVAVKCIDITQNTDCEGQESTPYLTLRHESVGIEQD